MKTIGSAILSCVLCFTISVSLHSQAQLSPTIIAPTATVQPGTVFTASIKVVHFKQIVSMQFAMNWDTTVLRFRETKNFIFASSMPQLENFGTNRASKGVLSFSWFDENFHGHNLNDSTTIFSIDFDVIGSANSSTPLLFVDDIYTKREMVDTSEQEIHAEYHNGVVAVALPTDVQVHNTAPHLIQVEASYPNPFHDGTQVKLELKQAAQVRLMIQNLQGQTVYEEQRFLSSGAHTLQLTKEMFPVSGAYQYLLVSPDFIITQKLIFL